MKLLPLLPAATAAISVSLQADLGKVKESFRAIALNAQRAPIDETTKEIVRNMTQQIKEELEDALATDHTNSQNALNTALNAVNKCATDRTNSFAGTVASAESKQDRAGTAFHTCKSFDGTVTAGPIDLAAEATVDLIQKAPDHDYGYDFSRDFHNGTGHYDQSDHEQHAHDVEVEKCAKLNATVQRYTTMVRVQTQDAWCFPDPTSPWDDIYAENAATVSESFSWFTHMDGFESAEAARYFRERSECHLARDVHQKRVAQCNFLQHQFEFDYCQWSCRIDETCATYDSCYARTWDQWSSTKHIVQEQEIQFKAQQHALEHILCFSEEILKDETDITKCDLPECEGCSPALDIDYVDPHAQIACTEDNGDNEPCGTDWVQANFGRYAGSDIPVDTCSECAPCP